MVPLDTKLQEYVITDLTSPKGKKTTIVRTVPLEKTMDGYRFQLSFEPKMLKTGEATMGTLTMTDAQGKPVRNLEPLMGAFGHIVGFEDNFKTILHVHPMGKEPTQASERGGPTLQFHIEPKKPGFIK